MESAMPNDLRVQFGEKVILELCDGRKIIGKLDMFDGDKGNISVITEGESTAKVHGIHEIRQLRIPTPRRWILDDDSILTQAKGVKVSTDPLEYEIEFTDHTTLEGNTYGFRSCAVDNVGNEEICPTSADATITVDLTDPVVLTPTVNPTSFSPNGDQNQDTTASAQCGAYLYPLSHNPVRVSVQSGR